jgi:membrane protein implicated in regulation of membrane protease activity
MNIRGLLSSLFSLNALVWLAMLTGFAALLCLAAAAWFAMAPPLGAPLASLFTGLGLLVMAVLLVVVVQRTTHKSGSSGKDSRELSRQDERIEDNLRPLVGDRAAQWTREHTGTVVVGALAAGILLAASPNARRLVTRAAGPVLTRKAMDAYKDFSDQG